MYYALRKIGGLDGNSTKLNAHATIDAIPRDVTELGLQHCFLVLPYLEPNELCMILKSRPKVKSIDFSSCQLGLRFDRNFAADWISIFNSLPEYLDSLALCKNDLARLSADDLVNVIKALPARLKSLDLRSNDLGKFLPEDLAKALKALPLHLTSLNLGMNMLMWFGSAAYLIEIFRALPEHLTSLSLHHDDLARLSADDLVNVIKALPANLKSLDLSSNNLGNYLSADALIKILKALPPHLTSLDLSSNNLDRFSPADLIKILEALPKNLTSLDISGHCFDDSKMEALSNLLAESRIVTLRFLSWKNPRGYKGLSDAAIQRLHSVLLNNQRKALLHPNQDGSGISGLQALCGRTITMFKVPFDSDKATSRVLEIITKSQQALDIQGLKL